MISINNSIKKLKTLYSFGGVEMAKISEEEFEHKNSPTEWSKKEILGHLIDSATINHHRLIYAQIYDRPTLGFDGNGWVKANCYQEMDSKQLIAFWVHYNRFIEKLIVQFPKKKLSNVVITGEKRGDYIMTVNELFNEYVNHLEHHLRKIVVGSKYI